MTAEIVGLRGPVAPATDAEPWQAAVTQARADGATWGVLIYATPDEVIGRALVGCGRLALRGLLEEALEELREGEGE